MALLSWNEIRERAIKFSKEWAQENREKAEAQTFWNEFFFVFGVKRRTVASFEEPVKKLSGDWGYIDLFWPGTLLAEHKTSGQNLEKAMSQGMAYIRALKDSGRDNEIPRYLIISDFTHIALYDLEAESPSDESRIFDVKQLPKFIRHFAFIAGYKQHKMDSENPVNLAAVSLMCHLHDTLESGGYSGHDLKQFLVRILFCLFAEDTGIFPPQKFQIYLKDRTAEDGSDLGVRLAHLFEVLNTPPEKRQHNLDEHLAEFPYVNGDLFKENLHFATFSSAMRQALITCTQFDWSRISPAVFGSLFQSVMEPKERRQIGAHYTAEQNILKLVRPLFLDELKAEFLRINNFKLKKVRDSQLDKFQEKLSKLRFLDPACGCGNFLVITYRELRLLELEVLKTRYGTQHELTLDDVNKLSKIDVDQMFGIELEEFPARIAEVALWLMDHQMNILLSEAFSQFYLRIPLRKSPHIHVANALRLDWEEVISPSECSYILGNPPFIGKNLMTKDQSNDMELIWRDKNGAGVLDYVTGWYRKAAGFIQRTKIVVAFVSTSSIIQGEQATPLWESLFNDLKIKIHFAHRTFKWESEARGKAHVHVVIIGFANFDNNNKLLFEYENKKDNSRIIKATNINAYLVNAPNVLILKRRTPLCEVPEIAFGSMPNDGGNLLLSQVDKDSLLRIEPKAEKFIKPLLSADEFLSGKQRWCIWLRNISPNEIINLPAIQKRIQAVKELRSASSRPSTQKLSAYPTLFGEIRQPKSTYILVPRHSSENRKYIPIGFFSPDFIVSDSCLAIDSATLYHFGILSSSMHMAWVNQICGRLESRYRYSANLVYNTFPWPKKPSKQCIQNIEIAAKKVIEVRQEFPKDSLATLYEPLMMPPKLTKAHLELDRAVDASYRSTKFTTEDERIEFLFNLYAEYTK